MILILPFAVVGLLLGGVINVLADDLPARVRPQLPHCPRCGHVYGAGGWLAVGRRLNGGACPECGLPTRERALRVEIGTALLFGLLPIFVTPVIDLVIYSLYVAVLVLVIVIDAEHRLVLHVVTFPTTVFAVFAGIPLTDTRFLNALVGAAVGLVFFLLAYLVGNRLFGAGALGFGDVTLATMMGAMLGFHRIFIALLLGILLAGLWSLAGILSGRMTRHSYFAYGPFLAVAGILMIFFGNQLSSRIFDL